jgi:hypothetical protein
MIELGGERFDLRELLRLNSLPDMSVAEENGRFYMRAADFNSCTTPRQVLDRGIEIVRVVNGIARVEIQNWENIRVIGVARNETNGVRKQFLFAQSRGRSRTSARATVTRADGTTDNSDRKSTFESFLGVARRDAAVERARAGVAGLSCTSFTKSSRLTWAGKVW